MLTRAQIDNYIKEIPADTEADERRAAYATITGFAEDKSVNEIVSYYSLNKDSVLKWMAHFDFSSRKPEKSGRRTSKTKMIEDYLAKNVGKVVNFTEVATELNISTPTVYNFYNANRLYFKKVSRGSFEILDPKAERSK
jgi:predicted AAA+ superfamily ATPase